MSSAKASHLPSYPPCPIHDHIVLDGDNVLLKPISGYGLEEELTKQNLSEAGIEPSLESGSDITAEPSVAALRTLIKFNITFLTAELF